MTNEDSSTASRRAQKQPDWKAITPATLEPAIRHIRKIFDESIWKCSEVTEKLCFRALHPEENPGADIDVYLSSFALYRKIIGLRASQEFDRNLQLANPAAIFHAYLEAFSAGVDSEIQRVFGELLPIGVAHVHALNQHPVDWAKSHLSILISGKKHVVQEWIKDVCDGRDYSRALKEDFEEFIFRKHWRAPKLIYMQPSGGLPYIAERAWEREDETKTKELLDGLSTRFTDFLGFHLDKLAGSAHVQLAKKQVSRDDEDRRFAEMAIEEASKSASEDDRPHPKVGAIVVKNGTVLSKAHRGENPRSHAEYIALEDKLSSELVTGATVYTTLEPCTTRNHPKIPCAQRLVDRRVARVVIGMLDPNPDIRGRGDQLLSDSGIEVQLFPRDLRAKVEEMNRAFIKAQRERERFPVSNAPGAPPTPRVPESELVQYEGQRSRVPETPLLRKIWSQPRWRVLICPMQFRKARFQSVERCRQFVLASEVMVHGWFAFPSFSRESLISGSEWVYGEMEHAEKTLKREESWALFQSAQFVYNRSLENIVQLGERVHVLEVLDITTAAFEFAARMADRSVLPDAYFEFTLHGAAGRALTWPQDIFGDVDAVQPSCWCQDEETTVRRQVTSGEFKARRREVALDVALELFNSWGWRSAPKERLRVEQGKRFGEVA